MKKEGYLLVGLLSIGPVANGGELDREGLIKSIGLSDQELSLLCSDKKASNTNLVEALTLNAELVNLLVKTNIYEPLEAREYAKNLKIEDVREIIKSLKNFGGLAATGTMIGSKETVIKNK